MFRLIQGFALNNTDARDSEEAQKLEALLQATTTLKPNLSSAAKTETNLADHEYLEPQDNSFHIDRLPELSDDELISLDNDANPLYFLKQLLEPKKPQSITPDATPGAPVYITIPIYINTSGNLPLSLKVGDQEVSLHAHQASTALRKYSSTKSPNSYFNRLLEQIEPHKRRTTNRHRSQSRSKNQGLRKAYQMSFE